MNETQYIDFIAWLEMPAHAVKPFGQLTDEDKSGITGSLVYHRFQLKQASDRFSASVRNSLSGIFTFLKP